MHGQQPKKGAWRPAPRCRIRHRLPVPLPPPAAKVRRQRCCHSGPHLRALLAQLSLMLLHLQAQRPQLPLHAAQRCICLLPVLPARRLLPRQPCRRCFGVARQPLAGFQQVPASGTQALDVGSQRLHSCLGIAALGKAQLVAQAVCGRPARLLCHSLPNVVLGRDCHPARGRRSCGSHHGSDRGRLGSALAQRPRLARRADVLALAVVRRGGQVLLWGGKSMGRCVGGSRWRQLPAETVHCAAAPPLARLPPAPPAAAAPQPLAARWQGAGCAFSLSTWRVFAPSYQPSAITTVRAGGGGGALGLKMPRLCRKRAPGSSPEPSCRECFLQQQYKRCTAAYQTGARCASRAINSFRGAMAQPPTGPPAGLPDLGQGMEQARHLLQQNKPMEALRVGGTGRCRRGAAAEGVSGHWETTVVGAALCRHRCRLAAPHPPAGDD
jgi:hypothetical protein